MAATAAWLARTQKRQNGELGMFRVSHPSEASTVISPSSTYSPNNKYNTEASPPSSHSSVSTTNSLPESYAKIQALQTQLQKNNAQIEANEKRMRDLSRLDDERGAMLSRRLAEISELNKQLDSLSALVSRAEKIGQGNFHAGLSD